MASKYTPEQKAKAIMRAEELGNKSAAAREAGVPINTLRSWMENDKDEVVKIGQQVKHNMLEKLEQGAMLFYEQILEHLDDDYEPPEGKKRERKNFSPGQKLTGFGIFADKVRDIRRLEQDAEANETSEQWLKDYIESKKENKKK